MDRRAFLKASAATSAAVAIGSSVGWQDLAYAGSGCKWGARCDPYRNESVEKATRDFQSKINRKIAVTRQYAAWDRDLPDHYTMWTANNGIMPIIAWHAKLSKGGSISFSSIANGAHDAQIIKQAKSLKAWRQKAYFCFHHEPENDPQCGGATSFKAAWSRVHQLFQKVGTPNLTWMPIFMASTYAGGHGGISRWMPSTTGTLYGVDGYNRGACDPTGRWRSFEEIFTPARHYAKSRGHGLFIPEYGCVEDNSCGHSGGDPTRKATWITRASKTIRSWPELKGVNYSNTEWVFNGAHVNYRITTSKQALSAYKAAGAVNYFL